MLTQRSRNEIKDLVDDGVEPISKWLDSLELQVDEAPESYSGELIDKRPEATRKPVEPVDLDLDELPRDDFDLGGPAIEIQLGAVRHTPWRDFKAWIRKNILRIEEKTEDEEVKALMEQFGLFSDLHDGQEEDPVVQKPKDMLPDLTKLRQALAYAELMMPLEDQWNDVRDKCKVIRKKLNTSMTPTRSSSIHNSRGSRVTLDVEVSKEVEIPPEVISREIMAARRNRGNR